jgi:hypothetical protein
MSEEVELVAKATSEVVAALADESGALTVPREYANYVAARIHLRHYPRLVRSAMAAAEKIKASGLPQRAFSVLDEPLLTAILEGMAEETDPDLQEAWQNLLANALVRGQWGVKRAFPSLLSRLESNEVVALDRLAEKVTGAPQLTSFWPTEQLSAGLEQITIDNLIGLAILHPTDPQPERAPNEERLGPVVTTMPILKFTYLGYGFVKACRAPRRPR